MQLSEAAEYETVWKQPELHTVVEDLNETAEIGYWVVIGFKRDVLGVVIFTCELSEDSEETIARLQLWD